MSAVARIERRTFDMPFNDRTSIRCVICTYIPQPKIAIHRNYFGEHMRFRFSRTKVAPNRCEWPRIVKGRFCNSHGNTHNSRNGINLIASIWRFDAVHLHKSDGIASHRKMMAIHTWMCSISFNMRRQHSFGVIPSSNPAFSSNCPCMDRGQQPEKNNAESAFFFGWPNRFKHFSAFRRKYSNRKNDKLLERYAAQFYVDLCFNAIRLSCFFRFSRKRIRVNRWKNGMAGE